MKRKKVLVKRKKKYRSRCGKVKGPTYWTSGNKFGSNLVVTFIKSIKINLIQLHSFNPVIINKPKLPKSLKPAEKRRFSISAENKNGGRSVKNCWWKSEIWPWKATRKWLERRSKASDDRSRCLKLIFREFPLALLPEFRFQWPFQGRLSRLIPYNVRKIGDENVASVFALSHSDAYQNLCT